MVKNTFKLKKHGPFYLEGEKGKYEIPSLDTLPYDTWKDLAISATQDDVKIKIEAFKTFFLEICPDIAYENLGDYNWMTLGTAYMAKMGE